MPEDDLLPARRESLHLADRLPPGEDLTRIISLTDGVFAFALTLLVLSLVVPMGLTGPNLSGRLGAALNKDWTSFLAYVFAFFLIANWWVVHHRYFTHIKRYDGRLVGFNMAILLEIAVMPFVLSTFALYSDALVAVVLFAATQAATGLTFAILWRYATWKHRLVDKSLDPRIERYYALRGLVTPIVFAVSIGVAFLSVEAAEFCWIGIFVIPRLTHEFGLADPDPNP
jgi:uncharacterized membrane protein